MLLETFEYLGIAFICSVLLIIMSKIILQALIRRPVDYYNARELKEEELMLNAGGISITKEHETNPEGEIIEEKHLEAQLGDIEAAEKFIRNRKMKLLRQFLNLKRKQKKRLSLKKSR